MASIQRFLLTVLLLSLVAPAEAQFLKKLRRAVDDVIVTPNERNPSCSHLTLTETEGVIFSDDFESGKLGSMWASRPSEDNGVADVVARIDDVERIPHEGDYALALGLKERNMPGAVINAADLCLDASNQSNLTLHFFIRDEVDRTSDNDAILLSDDGGERFYSALRLNPINWADKQYGMVSLDLSAAARQLGLEINDQFVVRFQQEGNMPFNAPRHFRNGLFIDNITLMGAPVYARPPFHDGFESDTFGPSWRAADPYRRGETALELESQWGMVQPMQRISDVPAIPRSGDYALAMGLPVDAGAGKHVNAADLHLNLEGREDATLRFFLRHQYDEVDDADGIYLSDDGGARFEKALTFENTGRNSKQYREVSLDLVDATSKLGMTLSSTFVIRIQQRGNRDFVGRMYWSDGYLIDDLTVETALTPKEEAVASLDAAFAQWEQRGKYEKTEAHELRLREQAETARDSLTQIILADVVSNRIDLSAAQTAYNADSEVFMMSIEHLDPFIIPVPISEAESFDQNLSALEYNSPVYSFGSGDALKFVSAEVVNPANGNTYMLKAER